MTPQILIRPLARQDLIDQFLFLSERTEETALRFLEMVETTLEELAKLPEMGSSQKCKHPLLAGLRRWRVRDFEKHLIFYRTSGDGIEVLRFLYATRDIETVLEEG